MIRTLPRTADEWLARAKSRRFTTGDQKALEAWLAASPDNQLAYERSERVSELGVGLKTRSDLVRAMPIYEELAHPQRSRHWAVPAAVAAGVACMALFLAVSGRVGPSDSPLEMATAHGEQRQVRLADGTRVDLNTDTALKIAYSDSERRVHLDRGEGFFDVVKEARPFVVQSGTTEVRVVGTRFSVRATEVGTDVVVAEGKVDVVPDTRGQTAASPAKVELVPGNALRLDRRESFVRIAAIDPERVTAWRTGTIRFENATIPEVIAEVNRYARTPFVIDDDARTRDIRLSGSFRIGDLEAVRYVLKSYGLESVNEDGRIVLR